MGIKTVDGIILIDANGVEVGSRFFEGDKVTISVKDATATEGYVYFTGRIDSIHRVEKQLRLDCSAEFSSDLKTIKFDAIVGIAAYPPATTTTTTGTATATATTGTAATATETTPTAEAATTETTPTVESTAPTVTTTVTAETATPAVTA